MKSNLSISLSDVIIHAESISITGEQIKRICNNNVNVILYEELKNINDISLLFNKYNAVAILYQNESKYMGHWCALCYNELYNIIYFFDPYGYYVDDELALTIYDDDVPYLRNLLDKKMNEGTQYICNNEVMQQFNHKNKYRQINTCGRWVGLRCLMNQLTNIEFNNFFKMHKRINTADDITVVMTLIINLQDNQIIEDENNDDNNS